MKCLALVSGGLDSVTMAYMLKENGSLGGVLSFLYGQKHKKELPYALEAATVLDVSSYIMDLSPVGRMIQGSALTDPSVAVPSGEYAYSNIEQTIVPGRNLWFLSLGMSVAICNGMEGVAISVHGGDHPVYPDCRREFLRSFQATAQRAFGDIPTRVYYPFVQFDKAAIVRLGASLGVPFDRTWSCYRGGVNHCGTCSTCLERKKAFEVAGVDDPTVYEE